MPRSVFLTLFFGGGGGGKLGCLEEMLPPCHPTRLNPVGILNM